MVTGRGNSSRETLGPIGALSTTFGHVVSDPLRPDTLPVPLGLINATDFGAFEAVTLQHVQKLLRQVNPRKATGSDSVPGLVLREAAYVLAPSLLDIFNVSLSTGCVPAAFKKSNVAPLYKSGDPCQATNYRLVSLLPIVSCLLEKVVQTQFTSYLNRRNLFPGTQFAYHNNHFTEDALVYAVNRWQEAKQKRQTTGIVIVDMSKAFHKASHRATLASQAMPQPRSPQNLWYVAMVQSKLCYGSNAIFPSLLERGKATISKLSKAGVRAVFGLHNPVSTQPLLNELHVSEITDIMFRKALVFVFRCLDVHASSLSTHYYTPIASLTDGNHRLTRGQEARLLSVPFLPGPAGRTSIQFSGVIGWNLLCHATRMSPFVDIFKARIKSIKM